ncbi:hypothetical protein PTE30175_04246 [Pandoraea terrae]|uniref:Glycosyl hydrolase family 43 n=1 Tax=Pandoraea terrae TaxID=1537710 RepID=A0A5E4Y7P7_9BURK|nr:hypothetical protein [Pandoraea terrae]VVE44801.1 hypothetical protein PTE30175_04246 [Pandoraea terrae]
MTKRTAYAVWRRPLWLCAGLVLSAACLTGWAEPGGASNISSSRALFELPDGVNEFELVYSDGDYYFFHHAFNAQRTMVRRASSVAGLANALDAFAMPGLYPTAIVDNGVWHGWVWDGARTVHYVAPSWDGPYERTDVVDIPSATDWQVRRNPEDGLYYASYKDINSLTADMARAPSPNGPWERLGPVFASDQRASWHRAEEADAAVFFEKGRVYITFAGWGASRDLASGEQVIGIVELNPITFKAVDEGQILLHPSHDWQLRGGGRKIFNPVFLAVSDTPPRVYYAVNPSTEGVTAGWGYVDNVTLPTTLTAIQAIASSH